jgi:tryptophanyl-tRNA synthetase
MPEYIKNIFQLMNLVSEPDITQKFMDDFNNASIRYGDFKKQLAEDMVKFIAPIRNKANDIYQDKTYLISILRRGSEKARESSSATMKQVRQAMLMNYI